MLFFMLTNVQMPTIVGILTFMSRENFMLSLVEHGKSIITSGPVCILSITLSRLVRFQNYLTRYFLGGKDHVTSLR